MSIQIKESNAGHQFSLWHNQIVQIYRPIFIGQCEEIHSIDCAVIRCGELITRQFPGVLLCFFGLAEWEESSLWDRQLNYSILLDKTNPCDNLILFDIGNNFMQTKVSLWILWIVTQAIATATLDKPSSPWISLNKEVHSYQNWISFS